jgi:hypothetical protein
MGYKLSWLMDDVSEEATSVNSLPPLRFVVPLVGHSNLGNNTVPEKLNRIKSVSAVGNTSMQTLLPTKSMDMVDIHLESDVYFPVMNRLPELKLGGKIYNVSRFADNGSQNEIIFTIPKSDYEQLSNNELFEVKNGKIWVFKKYLS